MANFVLNKAKGRVVELYIGVQTNAIAAAQLVLIPCSAGDTEANVQDTDNVTATLATAVNEQTAGGWVRKDLDATLAAYSTNDTDNRGDVALPSVTWTGPTAANNTTTLLVCYDVSGTDADGTLWAMTHHDFAVTADGNDVVLNAGNFFQAS
jgi:hypothetical protein